MLFPARFLCCAKEQKLPVYKSPERDSVLVYRTLDFRHFTLVAYVRFGRMSGVAENSAAGDTHTMATMVALAQKTRKRIRSWRSRSAPRVQTRSLHSEFVTPRLHNVVNRTFEMCCLM